MLHVALPTLAILAMLLAPTGIAPPVHDHEGQIVFGTGDLRAKSTFDHAYLFSPVGAVGFNIEGDVEHEYLSLFDSSGAYYRVILMSPLGTRDVDWRLDWVMDEDDDADVAFDADYHTTCLGLFCTDPALP